MKGHELALLLHVHTTLHRVCLEVVVTHCKPPLEVEGKEEGVLGGCCQLRDRPSRHRMSWHFNSTSYNNNNNNNNSNNNRNKVSTVHNGSYSFQSD